MTIALILGLIVGLILGLTGAGGGAIAVPLLMWGLGWTLPQAAPVALLSVAISAGFGTVAAWDRTQIRYRAATLVAACGILSAPLGLWLGDRLPAMVLGLIFAALLLLLAVRMWRNAQPARPGPVELNMPDEPASGPICEVRSDTGRINWTRPCLMALSGAGLLTGFLSGLLGVGGGFVMVPALRFLSPLSMHAAVATALMAAALGSTMTFIIALIHGRSVDVAMAVPFVLGSIVGLLAGRKLVPMISGKLLQRLFAVMLVLVAALMTLRETGLLSQR